VIRTIPTILLVNIFLICSSINPVWAKEITDWGRINPKLKRVLPLKSTGNPDDEKECLLCHKKYIGAFGKTIHAKIFVSRKGNLLGSACETCHGPMVRHLRGKTRKERNSSVVSFKSISQKKKDYICLQCHDRGSNDYWQGSLHEMSDVTCSDCHYILKKRSKRGPYISENPNKTCFQCHRGIRAKFRRASHMPEKERKVLCSNCHDAHGGPGDSLLKRPTVNETCYQCHQEKRGPNIWEHPPVRENCSNCHDPHGSNFKALLKLKPPYLCQQCHMNEFHPSSIYEGSDLANNEERIIEKSCLNCHSVIHGSSHPSGARFQR
jgi:DmsE family decaheme c-type cytochrome